MTAARGLRPAHAVVLLACVAGDPIVATALLVRAAPDRAEQIVAGTLHGGVPFTVGATRDWIARLRARGLPTLLVARARHAHLLAVAAALTRDLGLPDVVVEDTLTGLALVSALLAEAARDLAAVYAERARAAHLGIGGPS